MSNLLSDKINGDGPREKIIAGEIKSLRDYELLAVILGTGNKNVNVIRLSKEIIHTSSGVENLYNMSLQEIIKYDGVGYVKATRIMALAELIKRNKQQPLPKKYQIKHPRSIYEYFNIYYYEEKQEKLIVVVLDTKNNIVGFKNIYVGTINKIEIHAREIFNYAIRNMASKIILVHNHPSGDPTPSVEDISVTKELIKSSKIIDIEILDHIIIGKENYHSLRENCDIIFKS